MSASLTRRIAGARRRKAKLLGGGEAVRGGSASAMYAFCFWRHSCTENRRVRTDATCKRVQNTKSDHKRPGSAPEKSQALLYADGTASMCSGVSGFAEIPGQNPGIGAPAKDSPRLPPGRSWATSCSCWASFRCMFIRNSSSAMVVFGPRAPGPRQSPANACWLSNPHVNIQVQHQIIHVTNNVVGSCLKQCFWKPRTRGPWDVRIVPDPGTHSSPSPGRRRTDSRSGSCSASWSSGSRSRGLGIIGSGILWERREALGGRVKHALLGTCSTCR